MSMCPWVFFTQCFLPMCPTPTCVIVRPHAMISVWPELLSQNDGSFVATTTPFCPVIKQCLFNDIVLPRGWGIKSFLPLARGVPPTQTNVDMSLCVLRKKPFSYVVPGPTSTCCLHESPPPPPKFRFRELFHTSCLFGLCQMSCFCPRPRLII